MPQLRDHGVEFGRLEFSCVLYLGLSVILSRCYASITNLQKEENGIILLPGIL